LKFHGTGTASLKAGNYEIVSDLKFKIVKNMFPQTAGKYAGPE